MKAALSLCGGDQDYFGRNVAQMFLSVYRKVALPSSVPEAVWHLKSDCDSGHKFTLILKFHKHKINLVTGEQEGGAPHIRLLACRSILLYDLWMCSGGGSCGSEVSCADTFVTLKWWVFCTDTTQTVIRYYLFSVCLNY